MPLLIGICLMVTHLWGTGCSVAAATPSSTFPASVMNFQHIVVPTDFSEVARHALRFAAQIARHYNSQIHLIHVYEKPYVTVAANGALVAQVNYEEVEALKRHINHQTEELMKMPELQGLKISRKLISDIPTWQFAQNLGDTPCDLIVMGTRGQTGILHGGLVGTNAARVLRTAKVPVLVVPDDARLSEIRTIVFATDFATPVDDHFGTVSMLAQMFGSEIVMAVINTRESFLTTAFANAEYTRLKNRHPYPKMRLVVYNDEDVETGIKNYLIEQGGDLLTMFTHGRTGLNRLISGSIVEDLAEHVRVPLLALKGK